MLNYRQHLNIAVALALLVCLLPMPYGYYTLVRLVAMVLFGILSFGFFARHNTPLYLLCAFMACLFQPLVKFPLGREMWMLVDVVAAGLLLWLTFRQRNSK